MRDGELIAWMVQRGREAGEIVTKEFSGLTLEQLNWKSAADRWSIAQCLEHLVIANSLYFPAFEKITKGAYKMSPWQRWSPFSSLFGKLLVRYLQEKATRKMKTAKIFVPASSSVDKYILERFRQHLDTLLTYLSNCREIDLDKTIITSPVSKFITYNLRNAITMLVQHVHRHVNQAIRVKLEGSFPLI